MSDMPSTIGPYEISRELGRGGMGVVYLARDTRLDRDVAIKALPAELAADPARLERFAREAKLLAGLSHPNIAGIYGVEEREGAKYLVLEYVEGETLADRLDRGPLPLHDALEVAVQIAAGVEAAHDAGVIHRDLKSGNVILTPEGKATVLDFGLARSDDGSLSSSGAPDAPTMTTPQHSPTIEGAILDYEEFSTVQGVWTPRWTAASEPSRHVCRVAYLRSMELPWPCDKPPDCSRWFTLSS